MSRYTEITPLENSFRKFLADGIIEYLKLVKKEEPKKLVIEEIEKIDIALTTDASLWDLNFTNIKDAKAVKQYKKGDTIGNIVAVATHPCGSKYYMTEYSYKNKVNNGFNVVDCEKYERRKCSYCGKYS